MESIKNKMYDILTELNKLNGEKGMLLLGGCGEFDIDYRVIEGDGDETAVRFELSVPAGPTLVILAKGVNVIRDVQIAESITFDMPRYLGIRELVYLDVLNDTTLTALTVEFIKLLASNEEFQSWWMSVKSDETLGLLERREQNLKRLTDARMAITNALHDYNNDSKFLTVTSTYDAILDRVKTLSADTSNTLVFRCEDNNAIDFNVGAFSIVVIRVGSAIVVHIGADAEYGLTEISIHNLVGMTWDVVRESVMRSLNDTVADYFDSTDYAVLHLSLIHI